MNYRQLCQGIIHDMDYSKQENSAENKKEPADAPQLFAERFHLLQELGRGGMAVVYRARELVLEREVALKLLEKRYLKDAESLERFSREARLLSSLDSPYIVKTYSSGVFEGQPYIVMELLEGRTLQDFLRERQNEGRHGLDIDEFRAVFLPLMDALSYAHEKDIVHRDLKPANIMLLGSIASLGWRLKILDFGIAKLLNMDCENDPQLTVAAMGTPYYASPEQCAGKPVDKRSDIYSLACIMYESIVGKPPFAEASAFETMYAHLKLSVPTLAELSLSRGIPQALFELIINALAKEPEARPQSMSEFRSLTLAALEGKELLRAKRSWWQSSACMAAFVLAFLALSGLLLAAAISNKQKESLRSLGYAPKRFQRYYEMESFGCLSTAVELRSQKKYKEAWAMFCESIRRAKRSNRQDWICSAHFEAGKCLAEMGRLDEAEKELSIAKDVFPDPLSAGRLSSLRSLVGVISDRKKELDRGFELYESELEKGYRALSQDSADMPLADCYSDFSWKLYSNGRYKEALRAAKRSLLLFDRLLCGRRRISAVDAAFCAYKSHLALKNKKLGLAELEKTRADLLKQQDLCDADIFQTFAKWSKDAGRVDDALVFYKLCLQKAQEQNYRNDQSRIDHCLKQIAELSKKTTKAEHPQAEKNL